LGSFGCGVFAPGTEEERLFRELVVSEMAEEHQEEGRGPERLQAADAEVKRLNWMGDLVEKVQ